MATAKELNLQKGDLVVTLGAKSIGVPSRRYGLSVDRSTDLDDPLAVVVTEVVEVVDFGTRGLDTHAAIVKVLWTNANPGLGPIRSVGTVTAIDSAFMNYFSQDDPRIVGEFNRANTGARIEIAPDRRSVALTRGEWTEVIS